MAEDGREDAEKMGSQGSEQPNCMTGTAGSGEEQPKDTASVAQSSSQEQSEEAKSPRRRRKFLSVLEQSFARVSVLQQLTRMHILGMLLPFSIVAIVALVYIYSTLIHYNERLLESDNQRVTATLYEITARAYTISNRIAYDKDTWTALSSSYPTEVYMHAALGALTAINDYAMDSPSLDFVEIYTDNPDISDYLEYRHVTETVRASSWYRSAILQQSPLWVGIPGSDRGESGGNICLVRSIPMQNSSVHAVLVIGLDDSYLKTRLESSEYSMVLSIDREPISFASDPNCYDRPMEELVPVDYGTPYYRYTGRALENHGMTSVSEIQPYRSESVFYVASFNEQIYPQIRRIMAGLAVVFAVAIIGSTLTSRLFARFFTRRVARLRSSMHTVSEAHYDIPPEFEGGDELSDIYRDLLLVVQRVQEADRHAYEAQIQEKELESDQQAMRFKILASQINPHFLYNTLESIRMKALAEGSRSTAGAIKTLGKIMRYVLNSSVTVGEVPLSEGLAFAKEYMSIMEFRFGDRLRFCLDVDTRIHPDEVYVLPLIIQPIIENSVLHGLDEVEEGGEVRLSVRHTKENLELQVEDNGCGMNGETLQNLRARMEGAIPEEERDARHGLALHNIQQRIRLRYGREYGLRITSAPGEGTSVTVLLPYLDRPLPQSRA